MTITAVEVADSRPVLMAREKVERGIGIALLVGVTAWLIWNFVAGPVQFVNVGLAGLRLGAIYALIALGYTLVYGIIELINFAHGDLFMLGSVFSALILVKALGADSNTPLNWILMIGVMVLVMAMCATLNVTAEFVAYRRLRRAPKLAPLITAVGISFIFQWFGLKLNGSAPKSWPKVIPDGGLKIGSVTIDWSTIIVIGVTIPLLLLLSYIVQRTRQGKAMRATAQDQDAARLMGINVNRTISFTFALGGAMAGAAGMLYLETFGTTRYDAGFQLGLIAFTAAVLGGIGNLQGAVLGGFLIGLIQGFNDGLPYGLGQKWSQTVVFTILILLMVFKPEGILGKPTIEKV
ncbi:MAG: branched-chain amino acid ABC transporter permease [Frankiales bacterium]|nr:branched-chain amino acid ABC transporter permease [Frankiales bacterium]